MQIESDIWLSTTETRVNTKPRCGRQLAAMGRSAEDTVVQPMGVLPEVPCDDHVKRLGAKLLHKPLAAATSTREGSPELAWGGIRDGVRRGGILTTTTD